MSLKLVERDGAVRVEIHAKPRAKRSAIVGVREGAVVVALGAPPVDGAANEELLRFLADRLGVPRRRVELLRGETAARKLVAIHGVSPADVARCLAAPDSSSDTRPGRAS